MVVDRGVVTAARNRDQPSLSEAPAIRRPTRLVPSRAALALPRFPTHDQKQPRPPSLTGHGSHVPLHRRRCIGVRPPVRFHQVRGDHARGLRQREDAGDLAPDPRGSRGVPQGRVQAGWRSSSMVVAHRDRRSRASAGLGPRTAIAFVAGAFASGLAGYFGMHTATRSAVRTTSSRRPTACSDALKASRSAPASVMGMCVVGLGLLGVAVFMLRVLGRR